jgi:uncharacterized integral membrane protein (TIGR00698 family)
LTADDNQIIDLYHHEIYDKTMFSTSVRSLLRSRPVRAGVRCTRYPSKYRGVLPSWTHARVHYFVSNAPDDEDTSLTKQNDNEKEKQSKPSSSSSSIIPGIALAAATAFGGFSLASLASSAMSVPVSGIPVSILLGMLIQNSPIHATSGGIYQQSTFQPGIIFCTKTVLQTGIVAVAAKLSFLQLLATGSTSLPVVVSAVGAGLLFIPAAGRWAGLPRRMTLLLTAGTSICGVTAITALAPAIGASHRDMAVAVANTVAFGTVGMLVYPHLLEYLYHGVGLLTTSEQVGMCLGVAIHDTSQVLGAALSYKETYGDDVVFQTAAVTKLIRNLGLAVAIPALTYVHHKETAAVEADQELQVKGDPAKTISGLMTFQKYVPTFLVAFIGMSALRTAGDMALGGDVGMFSDAMDFIGNDISKAALGTAMAGVGLSTSASSLKGVGWRPFAVGGAGALVVGGTGLAVATMIM